MQNIIMLNGIYMQYNNGKYNNAKRYIYAT